MIKLSKVEIVISIFEISLIENTTLNDIWKTNSLVCLLSTFRIYVHWNRFES